jgi:hypothetical protein
MDQLSYLAVLCRRLVFFKKKERQELYYSLKKDKKDTTRGYKL